MSYLEKLPRAMARYYSTSLVARGLRQNVFKPVLQRPDESDQITDPGFLNAKAKNPATLRNANATR
jgi:hypothetical protein